MTALHKRLPLLTAGDIIENLGLNAQQVTKATATMDRIVRRAWRLRPAAQRTLTLEEFEDAVPPCHWAVMFEVCALNNLGRHTEAKTLTNAARLLNTAGRSASTAGARKQRAR
ncbi:hypothetical protein [Streptomyces sp. NPDC090026]|uniref:hypothetical protein n=1 Tax=Streptomyces sp. NPDC090026 TaxID=3365923 RepID=UPI00381F8291